MLDFFLYAIPWWVWGVLGLLIALAVARFFGLKVGVWVLSFVVGLALLARARQAGWKDKADQEKDAKADAVINRKESDNEIDAMGESARNTEFNQWMRDKPR